MRKFISDNKAAIILIAALVLIFWDYILRYLRRFIVQDVRLTDPNVIAFLGVIAKAEGTDNADGYRELFGGGHFDSFSDHPNVRVPFRDTYSTAAGRYQINHPTFVRLQKKLNTVGFTPQVQDRMALELIAERGAYTDIVNGAFNTALQKCSTIWASLPYSTAGQPTRSYDLLASVFVSLGGSINS